MARANAAYRLDTYPSYAPAPASSNENIRAIRTGTGTEKQPSLLATAAKMGAILLFVVAALCFARIALTSATVTTMIESDAISGQITEARSAGVALEMEQSVLSNTSAISSAAQRLGMVAPGEITTIALTPDVVAVDESGSLSLSDSLKNVAGIQE